MDAESLIAVLDNPILVVTDGSVGQNQIYRWQRRRLDGGGTLRRRIDCENALRRQLRRSPARRQRHRLSEAGSGKRQKELRKREVNI